MSASSISRRNLIKGATLAGAAGAMAFSAAVAVADEASDSYTFADTVKWDAEYDVVVLGMGFAGLVSAMEAADNGAAVLLCEKMEEGKAGGNSKVCGQSFACGDDDPDATMQYYTAMAAGRKYPEGVLEVITNGVAGMKNTIADKYGFNIDEFMSFTGLPVVGNISPEYPSFPGADKISLVVAHQGMSDSFLFQSMKSRLVDNYADKIDVWYATPGEELIQDPVSGAVIGVKVSRNGEERNVRALNGVCICTGGFENDTQMVQDYLGLIDYAVIGGLYNTGDGIKMAQKVGARLWHMSAFEGGLGMMGCGYNTPEGANAIQISVLQETPMNTGATIVVGDWGNRYQNESAPVLHGHMSDHNGIWENPKYPQHSWIIWDKTQMDAINGTEGLFDPAYADTVTECATVADAAAVIGCTADDLQFTIETFNDYATTGIDLAWNRPAETMRAFDGAAYYVMPLKANLLNTQGGPERNTDAQIVGMDGEPIPHLYSAGECGGITTCMYQGGTNVAECFIMGQLAGANAAAAKDPLPAYTLAPAVESTPAHLGDETDIKESTAASNGTPNDDGTYVGAGKGIGGEVPVTVTLDDDGKIASVTVGENSETEGIGSKAIEQLPEQFVGLSTADEIDAVDGVSGATLTSNALKAAIKAALGL